MSFNAGNKYFCTYHFHTNRRMFIVHRLLLLENPFFEIILFKIMKQNL